MLKIKIDSLPRSGVKDLVKDLPQEDTEVLHSTKDWSDICEVTIECFTCCCRGSKSGSSSSAGGMDLGIQEWVNWILPYVNDGAPSWPLIQDTYIPQEVYLAMRFSRFGSDEIKETRGRITPVGGGIYYDEWDDPSGDCTYAFYLYRQVGYWEYRVYAASNWEDDFFLPKEDGWCKWVGEFRGMRHLGVDIMPSLFFANSMAYAVDSDVPPESDPSKTGFLTVVIGSIGAIENYISPDVGVAVVGGDGGRAALPLDIIHGN